jgi:hypothetical protein
MTNYGPKYGKSSGKEWCNIQDGYGHLLDDLEPDNSDSEVDKAVKYILEKNIQVRLLNVKSSGLTSVRPCGTELKRLYPDIKIGRFTTGKRGEDGIIQKKWTELVEEASIADPKKCIQDFMSLKVRCSSFSFITINFYSYSWMTIIATEKTSITATTNRLVASPRGNLVCNYLLSISVVAAVLL